MAPRVRTREAGDKIELGPGQLITNLNQRCYMPCRMQIFGDHLQFPESDPRHHTAKLKQMRTEIMEHARQDVAKVTDPKAQALFEATPEVLAGLKKAYEHFERGTEGAWKTPAGSR